MKYSAQDIDRMRQCCAQLIWRNRKIYRTSYIGAIEQVMGAESMLVTYMSNGTRPEELLEEIQEYYPGWTWN